MASSQLSRRRLDNWFRPVPGSGEARMLNGLVEENQCRCGNPARRSPANLPRVLLPHGSFACRSTMIRPMFQHSSIMAVFTTRFARHWALYETLQVRQGGGIVFRKVRVELSHNSTIAGCPRPPRSLRAWPDRPSLSAGHRSLATLGLSPSMVVFEWFFGRSSVRFRITVGWSGRERGAP